MKSPRHIMILASAGSGKTYALTSRFIELLAAGAAPERIVALTFTRKAAGEFFEEILRKLARAARSDEAARKLGDDVGAALDAARCRRMLRQIIDAMPRLRLGTLDSFFARIVRAFPLELGLAGEFEILQEHAARVERGRVLRRMYARSGEQLAAAQSEFIEAFKRATFGVEEKQLAARLDGFLDQHQENFLAAPEAALWGQPSQIWPNGTAWLESIELDDAVRALRAGLGDMTPGQRARWDNFFSALEGWIPGAPLAGPVEYIVKNALAVWRDLGDGSAEMTVDRKKVVLSREACRALHQLIVHLVGGELRRRLETTRGIFAVLRGYEVHYHETVRRAGRLTFADVQRLLAPRTSGAVLSTGAISATDEVVATEAQQELGLFVPQHAGAIDDADQRRLLLDYRLDAEIDHWLLDEFQDTSFGQWEILRNLVDEVIQDVSGGKTFFCVGDVKQAIYAWREGDPRLFREILDYYNSAAPDRIKEQNLVASWRSGPALIEMVNAVFGAASVLAELFPGQASEAWNREWHDHTSAVSDRSGQAALLHAADESERWSTMLRLLEEIRPLDRGLTCAVLVKKNETAAAIANFLRAAGIAAIAESDLRIAIDNPIGTALLALLQAAAHPGDTLAREHVQMTPMAAMLAKHGLSTAENLTTRVLEQVYAEGFERAMEFWVRELDAKLAPDDAFSRRRAREFVAAAGQFDATGSRDIDEFIAFMERYTVRQPDAAGVVRVMTVHKSKGLGFDLVILPDLQGTRIDERRDGLAVAKAKDRSVQWVLDLPPRLFCSEDDVLKAYIESAEADACYENLSLLYVAMTRAKRAMYVITEPVGESKSRNYPRLLANALGADSREVRIGNLKFSGAWAAGEADWYQRSAETTPPKTATTVSRLAPLNGAPAVTPRRLARRPSAEMMRTRPVSLLFSADSTVAAEFGRAVHALLAEIEWLEGRTANTAWASRARENDGALVEVEQCLSSPALATIWRRPAGASSVEVWRERSFEIVLDDTWITGVFDRAVVAKDASGRPVGATVYDFKTDRLTEESDWRTAVTRHAPQLNLYRRVAGVLVGLPIQMITCEVVFTNSCRRAIVPPGD